MRPLRSRRSAAAAELGSLPSRSDRRCSAPARRPLSHALLASALLAPVVGDAAAESLRIIPSLTVRETYSNNIFLAPSGFERSDLVSELVPTLKLKDRLPVLALLSVA